MMDGVKALFGDGNEREFLCYFTSRFPRLLVHCYNVVDKEATDLLAEYFHLDASALALALVIDKLSIESEGSELTINCADVITIPEILQKLPNLKVIQFDEVENGDSKAVLTATCHNLVKSEIWSAESSKLLKAIPECESKQKLKEVNPQVTLEEILQKYPSLEELEVTVDSKYPVSQRHEANARIHQLKVLKIELCTKDEIIQQQLVTFILKQNNLQQFYFDSQYMYNPTQLLCQQLAAFICQLKRLSTLRINDEELFAEIEAFAANCRVANTRLEEFGCPLRHFKSLSSFLAYFTNLRKLEVNCMDAEVTKVSELISFMNKTQLASIWLTYLPPACLQLLQKLQVHSLQDLVIHVDNWSQVPAFDILQKFLPKHPNITEFYMTFNFNYDEPKLFQLIPMIVRSLRKLEKLVVHNCPKITPIVIKQMAALKTLKSWRINDHKSETFYKTKN